jgi:hypothetical protein
MSDIFNEIEEDIRRERMARLWKRFGPLVVAAAVLIVAGVSGWRAWDWYSAKQAAEAGSRYNAALLLSAEGKPEEAEAALDALAKDAPSGYSVLARFRAASELSATDKPAAAARFEAIAQDISVPALLRDLARIRSALSLLDTGSPADVASRVEPLATANNGWRHSAREILALAAWKAGNVDDTRRWSEELVVDPETPPGARARGQLLLDLAGPPAGLPSAPPTP